MRRLAMTMVFICAGIVMSCAMVKRASAQETKWPASMNPMAPVCVVGIDSDTLYYLSNDRRSARMYTGDFPIPRVWYTNLIETLREAKALVVVVDYVFMPREPVAVADLKLAKSISAGPMPVVMAFDVIPGGLPTGAPQFNLNKFDLNHVKPGASGMVSAPALALPYKQLIEAGASIGSAHQHTDRNGTITRGSLFVSYGDIVLPSLSLAAFMEAVGISPYEINLSGGEMDIRGTKFSMAGEASLRLALPPQKTVIPRYSFKDIVIIKDDYKKGALEEHKKRMRKYFEGRIVFVGPTDYTLGDLKKTDAGSLYPAVEVMAATTNQLMNIWARSRGISKETWQPEVVDIGEDKPNATGSQPQSKTSKPPATKKKK